MATTAQPEHRRALTVAPKTDLGETLDSIKGQDVEVIGVDFVTRNGKDDAGNAETYDVAIIYLAGGTDDKPLRVHTSSKPIREYLGKLADDDAFVGGPLWMTFDKVRSTANPSRSYWDVTA